jgi:phage baseplate assembly protein W
MSHVYSDFKSDLSIRIGGDVEVLYDEDVIIQSLKTIFSTVSGERVRNPIGSSLVRLLFEPVNGNTSRKIEREIRKSIELWESRVDIRSLSVIPYIDQNVYDVSIEVTSRGIGRSIIFRNRLRSFATN